MSALSTSSSVLVLGAGLTGLSTSFHLTKRGVPHLVLEKASSVGGHAVTVEEQGFRFDRTGHLLHLRDAEIRAQVCAWLEDDFVEVARKSFVYSHGVFTRYPYQANTYGLPPTVAYECLMGFLEARAAQHESPPADFEEYCLRTFGAGFSKHFMLPYNARLWGVEPREITTEWCERFVPTPRLEDVVAGAVGLNDRELGYNSSFIYPRRGIGALPDAMARGLPIDLGVRLKGVDWRKQRVVLEGRSLSYDHLVSSIPLDAMARALIDAPDAVTNAAASLRCNPLCYLDVALAKPPRRAFHWVYVPEPHLPFYRVGCYSNFSPAVAPDGRASLYVELVDRHPDPNTIVSSIIPSLIEMQIIERESDILFARLRRIEHAYVIYDHAYREARATILAFLEANNILSVGRYGGWNYSSMEDALLFGRDAAQRVIDLVT